MKDTTMFMMPSCPYCRQALQWQRELMEEYPELAAVTVRMIDEQKEPAYAEQFDYYYVPTYYVGEEKLHEGAATREIVERVLRAAL